MTTDSPRETILDLIDKVFDQLTRSERRLAEIVRSNYPFAGLGNVTSVAEAAGVSPPTVVRMVRKLGFQRFAEFQARLRHEIEETYSNPIAKHGRWTVKGDEHLLNRFGDAVIRNIRDTLGQLQASSFDAAAALIGERSRQIHIVGGRITGAVAHYLHTHLEVIRSGVFQFSANPASWPHSFLNMTHGDVLVIFDIRRYQREIERLARLAASRGIVVILFTDRWSSPIAKLTSHVFRCQTEVPSAWDSSVTILFLVEALIEAVQSTSWDDSQTRFSELETLFASTPLFRKPSSFGGEQG